MKESNNDTNILLQEMEKDRSSDLSKMNSHWSEFEKMMPIGPSTMWLTRMLNRNVVIGSITFIGIIFLLVFVFTKKGKINNQPTPSTEKRVDILKHKPHSSDTSSISKAADTITRPTKKMVRKKPSTFSPKTIIPATADTILANRKGNVIRKKKTDTSSHKGKLNIDSLQ